MSGARAVLRSWPRGAGLAKAFRRAAIYRIAAVGLLCEISAGENSKQPFATSPIIDTDTARHYKNQPMSIRRTALMTIIASNRMPVCVDAAEQTCVNEIVFDSNRSGDSVRYVLDIYSGVSAQLINDELVSGNNRFPHSAPGGNRVVFVSEKEEGLGQLFVVASDANGPRQLTGDDAFYAAPAWSPDGEWIAFRRARTANGACS